MTTSRTTWPAILAAVVLLSATSACSSSPSDPSVSASPSYSGTALTLTIGTDDSPGVPSTDQISHFASEVHTLSGGLITVAPRWHAEGNSHPADWDQAVARMVQAGDLDLGLGPTWAWDDLGVTSLRVLQAPFLVDSDPLTAKVVLDPDLSTELMAGLAGAGVQGVSLWPEGMRHPFGFDKPLLSPDDYAGTTIRSARSTTIADVFQALGAATSPAEPDATTMAGLQGEYVLKPNGIGTANVTFFPKVNVLYGNTKTLAGLDEATRNVLATAAAHTQQWAIEQTSDTQAGSAFCTDGGTLVLATDAQVDALKATTDPVTQAIAAEGGSAAIIQTIQQMKGTVKADPAEACDPKITPQHAQGAAEAALNGTYRFTLTKDDFLAAGRTAEDAYHNAGVQTWTLTDGIVHNRLDPSEHEFNHDVGAGPDQAEGTYQVDGNRLTFRFPAFNEVTPMNFKVLAHGDLQLAVPEGVTAPGADPEAKFTLATKTWRKIA